VLQEIRLTRGKKQQQDCRCSDEDVKEEEKVRCIGYRLVAATRETTRSTVTSAVSGVILLTRSKTYESGDSTKTTCTTVRTTVVVNYESKM
jgi:hypothetical protein